MPYDFVHDRAIKALAEDLAAAGAALPTQWAEACHQALFKLWVETATSEFNPNNEEFDYDQLLTTWAKACGLSRSNPQVEAAVARYCATFSDTICPYVGVAEALKALHDMGLRVGILSHVPWPGWACRQWYERHGWAPYVDFYSLSSDVGYIKPHPAHYEDTLKQAQCPVDQIAHVGDHPHRDVEGPKAFGMQTILKMTQGIYSEDALANCAPHAAIAHVAELPALLKPHLP
jgi:FMN phosphatase YigB (HAD superfamily)